MEKRNCLYRIDGSIVAKITRLQDEIFEACQVGHHGLSEFGSSRVIALGRLLEAVESGEDLSDIWAEEVADPDSGYQFDSEIYQLAIEAGCKE